MKTAFTFFIIYLVSYSSFAQPGTLDKQFGTNGKTIVPIPYNGNIYGSTLAPDDKPIAVGTAASNFAVFKFTPDGLPDKSFRDSGIATIIFPGIDNSTPTTVACQSDKKILVSGYGYNGIFYPDIEYTGLIIRLNETGTIDSSFGENGTIQVSQNGSGGYGSIAVQQDNSFFVIGYAGSSRFLNRFKENGELDKSFGQDGYAYLSQDYSYSYGKVKIEPDGKIVLAGSYLKMSIPRFSMQRYLANGTIDNDFGTNGTVITSYNNSENMIYDVGFQSDGKIIAIGYCGINDSTAGFATARYLTDGTLDNSYGVKGKATILFEGLSAAGRSLAVMSNDRLVIGGGADAAGGYNDDFSLVRLNPNGSLDSTFGTNGKTVTNFNGSDYITGVFLQKSNKIVAVGGSDTIGTSYCSIARYNNVDSKKQIIIAKIKHYAATHNNVQATSLNNVSIYPNPAQNVLHVAGLSTTQTKLTVVDLMGNVKLQAVANASSCNLNIIPLNAGNYLLKIEMNDEVVSKKFVKE